MLQWLRSPYFPGEASGPAVTVGIRFVEVFDEGQGELIEERKGGGRERECVCVCV